MKVFVAGATGVLGKRAVALLVADGHDVTAVARSPEKAELLRRLGARPVAVDLFDAAAVKNAVEGHEVVCNLATHIPRMSKAALPGVWSENDRIRSEASRSLVDAALATHAERYVQESIAFIYEDRRDEWIDEDTPLAVSEYLNSTLVAEANAGRFTESGSTGIVLRFAQFYGPDSHHTVDGFRLAKDGIAPVLGDAGAYQSSISTDDAAAAVVAALRAPAGIYNVGDDEPVTKREWADVAARAARVPRAVMVPKPVLRVGGEKVHPLARSHRISNRRFRDATGWAPRDGSIREGLPPVYDELAAIDDDAERVGLASRLALAILGVTSVALGLWAVVAPHSFYASFPFGRGWVAADGPYNHHLVVDFGGLNLALACVLLAAVVSGRRLLSQIACVAGLLYAVPHLAYHVGHLDPYGATDKIANVVTLSLAVVVPALVLYLTTRGRRSSPAAT